MDYREASNAFLSVVVIVVKLFSNHTSIVVNGKTSVEIVVSVSSEKGAMILQGVFSILLFIALFLMGIDIDLRVVKSVLRKPIGPAIGFFSQFVFMPLASYGIAMGLLKQGDNDLSLCSGNIV